MIFPIGDDNIKGGHFPIFSYSLIAVNIGIFLLEMAQGENLPQFFYDYGAIPREIIAGDRLFTLFTSLFLHGSLMHLLGNMLFLWIFADNIEATIGNGRFILFYLLGGLFAHAGHIFFNLYSETPTIGASGAISAVMGAYMVMFPTSRVRVLFLIFPFYLSAYFFLGGWIYLQVMSGLEDMSLPVNAAEGGGVAYWAHIGGFVFGVAMGIYYRLQRRRFERSMYV